MGKSKLIFLILALFAGNVAAQISVRSPTEQSGVSVDPDLIMPPEKFFINMQTAPRGKRGGSTTTDIFRTSDGEEQIATGPDTNNGGSFRVGCVLSHVAKDDPIVHPNRPGASHPHLFFGNTETGANTVGDMRFVGKSTCAGGVANKTGYWVPTLIYHCPADTLGCNRKRDGEIILPGDSALFYYKSWGEGPATSSDKIVWPPSGFQMITGKASNRDPSGLPGRVDCYLNAGGGPAFPNIPTVAQSIAAGGCVHLNFLIQFPVCWDGVNLDAPDHISHVKYNAAGEPYYVGCAGVPGNTTHTVHLPAITLNIGYDIGPGKTLQEADLDFIRLSSDPAKATATGLCATAQYNYCAGVSLHSDWKNGWATTANFGGFGQGSVTDLILRYCLSKGDSPAQHSDCHANLFYIDGTNRSWRLN